jgi:glycine cleavage system transcriptional repressor
MAAQQHVVLTALGDDRPGLVDEVTGYISARGGNLEDSRMVNLHGQFAMMMLVAGGDEVVARLEADLETLRRDSRVVAEMRPAGHGGPVTPAALPYRLNTWAMDHPGLVQSVAHVLRELGVNIENVETTLRPAPYTNTPLFEMELIISAPAQTPVAELREALGRLCDEMNIDWQLTAI